VAIDNQTNSGQHEYSYMYASVGNVQYLYDKAGNTTPDQVEGRLYDGGSNMYAYDGENRLLTVTKTADALSAACDTSLTLTTGGTGAWIAQTSEYCPDSQPRGQSAFPRGTTGQICSFPWISLDNGQEQSYDSYTTE
jgi:hypothetical protein